MNVPPDIKSLRKNFPALDCIQKYYSSLDFIDIYDDIRKLARKKNKPLSEIDDSPYSVGYFLDDKLLRIDNAGALMPNETYIIWENGRVKEAHEFYIGIRWGKKVSSKPQPASSWFYTYENDRVKKIVWLDYEDRKYYDHGEMKVTYDYEYDSKGLLLIQQTVMGTGKLWKKPDKRIYYDREKELFLKTCTITKSALIGIEAKASDNVINFNPGKNSKTCKCKKCRKPLSFIATVNLVDKGFNLVNINLTSLTILHCFDCLETQQYNTGSLNIEVKNKAPFTKTSYKFKRENDEEILETVFLKIGKQPIWIQGDEHPKCPKCNTAMKFVIEIKTDENLSNGIDTLAFGDSGKLYVFTCCDYVTTIPQWY